MCTSIIHNGKKTIVGWNLDILDMEYQVVATEAMVSINIKDEKEGWLPLFGANNRGTLWQCLPAGHLMKEVIQNLHRRRILLNLIWTCY